MEAVTCHCPAAIRHTGPGPGASAASAAWCACRSTSARTSSINWKPHGYIDAKERGDRYCMAEGAERALRDFLTHLRSGQRSQ